MNVSTLPGYRVLPLSGCVGIVQPSSGELLIFSQERSCSPSETETMYQILATCTTCTLGFEGHHKRLGKKPFHNAICVFQYPLFVATEGKVNKRITSGKAEIVCQKETRTDKGTKLIKNEDARSLRGESSSKRDPRNLGLFERGAEGVYSLRGEYGSGERTKLISSLSWLTLWLGGDAVAAESASLGGKRTDVRIPPC